MERGTLILASALASVPAALSAQAARPALGVAAMVVRSDPWFGGVGATLAIPVGSEVRLGALALTGRAGDRTALRAELTVQVVFDPTFVRSAWTWYVAGGLAGRTEPTTEGFLVALAGLERRSGPRGRWWIDAGVAGGARAALGYRVALSRRR